MMKRVYVRIKGRVQGVGFRFFAQTLAMDFDLTGYVKNSYDGSVIIEAQGNEENLNKFIDNLQTGNRFANVEDMEVSSINLDKTEKKFKVKY
ncbi:MAG: acylphosphatase [Clostridium sp.]|uniref:acylphosphatase n=1 Tax=Clostridium sp. TaxID=1506 RepID=UPI002A8B8ACA|nr:acylphosphatase [Clostridium sp.]MDY5099622.1 acylphosphatase [Clostridium sp.]